MTSPETAPETGPGSDGHHLRVSTAERDRVAHYLSEALTAGRLSPDEFSERSQSCYAATTYADLLPLLADLTPDPVTVIGSSVGFASGPPASSPPAGQSAVVQPLSTAAPTQRLGPTGTDLRIVGGQGSGGSAVSYSFFGDTVRNGHWTVPPKHYSFAQFGDNLLDLREARFVEARTRIQCYAMLGDVEIIVPPDITVHVSGFGIFGSVGGLSQTGPPGCPEVTITGYTLLGDVTARLKTKKEQRQLRKQERRNRRGIGR